MSIFLQEPHDTVVPQIVFDYIVSGRSVALLNQTLCIGGDSAQEQNV